MECLCMPEKAYHCEIWIEDLVGRGVKESPCHCDAKIYNQTLFNFRVSHFRSPSQKSFSAGEPSTQSLNPNRIHTFDLCQRSAPRAISEAVGRGSSRWLYWSKRATHGSAWTELYSVRRSGTHYQGL